MQDTALDPTGSLPDNMMRTTLDHCTRSQATVHMIAKTAIGGIFHGTKGKSTDSLGSYFFFLIKWEKGREGVWASVLLGRQAVGDGC